MKIPNPVIICSFFSSSIPSDSFSYLISSKYNLQPLGFFWLGIIISKPILTRFKFLPSKSIVYFFHLLVSSIKSALTLEDSLSLSTSTIPGTLIISPPLCPFAQKLNFVAPVKLYPLEFIQ